MGDWSNNLEYEHREYYGHFYDTDEDVHEEENKEELMDSDGTGEGHHQGVGKE